MNYKTRQPFPHAAYVEGQRNFTHFDRSLTSGLTDDIISSPGDFLYIDQASTGVVSVELNMRQGGPLAPILLAAGGSIDCDFSSIKLTATAQLNKTVRVVVGNGATIKGGANVNASNMSVSVVDGGLSRTLAELAFLGTAYVPAVAGQLSQAQLWNPAASGKRLYVKSCSFSAGTAQLWQMARYSSELGTAGGAAMNKYLASTVAAVGLIKQNTVVAATFTQGGPAYFAAVNTPQVITFEEPVVVPEGQGFLLYGSVANSTITANFEWYEQ